MSFEQAVQALTRSYAELSAITDLSPANQNVNDLLTATVANVQAWHKLGYGGDLLQDLRLDHVRAGLPPLCGAAESEMERYWANYFATMPVLSPEALQRFWYYKNYEDLVLAELALIDQAVGPVAGISFIGAGPLPMTVLIAALLRPSLRFECVDADKAACDMAQRLVHQLGLSARVDVVYAKGQHHQPPAGFFPIIASLVDRKKEVYALYASLGVSHFMVRDSEGVYQFIYHPAEVADPALWSEVGATPVVATRLNTSKIYRQR